MQTIQILWPEQRAVSAETIKMWASDSYYNNADRYETSPDGNSYPVYEDGRTCPEHLIDCIEWLNDTGEVTFARGSL